MAACVIVWWQNNHVCIMDTRLALPTVSLCLHVQVRLAIEQQGGSGPSRVHTVQYSTTKSWLFESIVLCAYEVVWVV